MKKYFWEEYNENTRNIRYKTLVERRGCEPLSHIYGMYYNKYIQKLSEVTIEEYTKQENREKFLTYLSKLLRNWELKMKTFEQYKKVHSQGKDWYVMSRIFPWKEWENKEIEEGIKFVREKWNSFEDSRERESFESWGVMFTLPENEWMY